MASSSKTKKNGVYKIVKATKRASKKTLRDLLLSKTFYKTFKTLVVLMVVSGALYFTYAFMGDAFSQVVVVSKSEILSKISKHTSLPSSDPEAVVRVQDAETLKKQNIFYENVKDGDYIIIYPELAVIYDLRNDSVVAVKNK